MEPGFKFRVSRGSLSLWYDRWSTKCIVSKQLGNTEISVQDPSMSIKDLCINDQWRWDNVMNLFVVDWSSSAMIFCFSMLTKVLTSMSVNFFFFVNSIEIVFCRHHQSLPTNLFRTNKHMSSNSFCRRCGSSNETIFHHLLDCPKAQRIWNRVNLDVQQHNLQQDRST